MFRIEKTERDGVLCLALTDEFTPEQVSEFLAYVEEAIGEGQTRILVNTEQVPFINSTAFGALVKACGILRAAGGELALAALQRMPKETFEVLQLGSMIRQFETEAQGVEHLKWVNAAVTSVSEDIVVEFRFMAHAEVIVAGEAWLPAALQTIGEKELQFLWQTPEGLDPFSVFKPDTRIETRSSLSPESEPMAMNAKAAVLNMVPTPEGAALVQVEFADLDNESQTAIREFVRSHSSE